MATTPRQEALRALARRYPDDYQRIHQSIKAGQLDEAALRFEAARAEYTRLAAAVRALLDTSA